MGDGREREKERERERKRGCKGWWARGGVRLCVRAGWVGTTAHVNTIQHAHSTQKARFAVNMSSRGACHCLSQPQPSILPPDSFCQPHYRSMTPRRRGITHSKHTAQVRGGSGRGNPASPRISWHKPTTALRSTTSLPVDASYNSVSNKRRHATPCTNNDTYH